jgi:drug/metabolite transporter (DMT)-like permease
VDEVAALLAVVAAASFALAATLWQKAQLGLEGASLRHPRSLLAVLADPIWLLGLAAQGVGIALQAAALDRGRVSIIQPLLVTAVIWALPLGYFLTGQRITKRMVSGAIIVVAGLGVFAAFGDPAGGVDDAPLSDWIVPIVVILAACVGLFLLARRLGATGRAATLGTLAGVLYGLSATLMKPVVESLHADGLSATLESWEFWVMSAGGLIGFAIQQMSLSTGRLVASVATVSVANPDVAVILGAIILQESLDTDPPWSAVFGVGGLTIALLGVIVIASTGGDDPAEPTPDRPPPEPATA